MAMPIDYEPRRAKHPPAAWFTKILMVAGMGMLLLGTALSIFTWNQLRESQNNSNYNWGPGAYIFGMLQTFTCYSITFTPVGAVLLLVGIRRLRAARANARKGAAIRESQGAG